MTADRTVENIRQAAEQGAGITLDAAEVADLHAELLRLYELRAVPQRSGADRLTGGLVWDLGKVLVRHNFVRAEGPGPAAEFAMQVVRLARAYEGGQ